MATYALIGRDGPQGVELRKQHRDAHLENLQPLDAAGRIRFGGPLLDDAGRPRGSVVIFEAGSLEEARALAARDPYVVQGVFESYELLETRAVFPTPR
jgi:uncharacterized protein YciI